MSTGLRALTTSLALAAVAVGYALVQGAPGHPALTRQAGTTAISPRPMSAPPLASAREILDRRATLVLSGDQTRGLEMLARAWSRESARLEADLQSATTEFTRFMDEARAARGTSLAEIQRRSADLREISTTLREARRAHLEAAARLLTDSQRKRLAHAVDALGGAR